MSKSFNENNLELKICLLGEAMRSLYFISEMYKVPFTGTHSVSVNSNFDVRYQTALRLIPVSLVYRSADAIVDCCHVKLFAIMCSRLFLN